MLEAGVVATTHAVWLPEAFQKRYDPVRVDAYGGAARRAKRAYLVAGYLSRSDKFVGRSVFSKRLAWHKGSSIDGNRLVHYQNGRPYLVWSIGLAARSRYDIKTFRVVFTYRALIPTTRPVAASLKPTPGAPLVGMTSAVRLVPSTAG